MSTKPTHVELERAIASVPGVEEAHVTLLPATGKSRLRIRLANGEDAPTVSWAISATLRERFGIVLDPGAIRPRLSVPDDDTPVGSDAGVQPVPPESASPPAGADAEDHGDATVRRVVAQDVLDVQEIQEVEEVDEAPTRESDEFAAAVEDKVVVIGDRVMLSEAARAVLSEAIEHPEPQAPLEGTTGPEPDRESGAPDDGAETTREAGAPDDDAEPAREAGAPDDDGPAPSEPEPARDATREPEQHLGSPPPRLVEQPSGSTEGGQPTSTQRHVWSTDKAADTDPTPEEAAALERPRECPRAAIRHLDTRIDVSDVRVTATLAHAGRYVTGEASSVPTRKGILRAVAEATVSALRQLTGDRLVVGVDSVIASIAGEPPMATVLVGVVTEAGEETLLGSSLVRQDPERAVMRATLDALNRRVEPWLEFDLAG